MYRLIASVVVGVIVGGLVIGFVEWLSSLVYPLPENMDLMDQEALQAYISELPFGALLFIILAWALGSFAGGVVSKIIVMKPTWPSVLTGIILMGLAVLNMIFISHPIWFWIAGLLPMLPLAYLGGKIIQYPDYQLR